jgi:hypothetical protein
MFSAEYEESEQDTREALAVMTRNLVLWKKRTLVAAVIFFVGCVAAFPFMDGHFLHRYWSSFGKFLPLLAIVLFVFLMHRVLLLHFVWKERRKAQRDLEDLLIRRRA